MNLWEIGIVRWAVLTIVLAFLAAGDRLAAEPSKAEENIAKALAWARDRNNYTEVFESKTLGQLASPAALAAAQPDLRAMFAAPSKRTIDFTDEQRTALRRNYRYLTFEGEGRSGEVVPMGITGAYYREFAKRHEIVVTWVEPGSPAAGVLEVDDVVIGANGRLFRANWDPRIPLGYAIAESQTQPLDGKLILQILRDGEAMNVSIDLGVSGGYSKTWPRDCAKTEQIADKMVRFVVENQGRRAVSRHGGGGFWAPLFLMASGDEGALEMARRAVHGLARHEAGWEPSATNSGHSWNTSYSLVSICEYYLLTGDSSVLPSIKFKTEVLEKGQSPAGGYGHSCPCSGYGEVNNVGFVALVGMALSRECGTEMQPHALANSIQYFGRWIGGSSPYGNHSGGGSRAGRGSNGTSGMGTLAFKFLGEEGIARRWGRASAYMWMTPESGHAEGIFNLAWGPLGVAMGTPEEAAMYHNNLLWYYELARTREGGMYFMRGGHFPYPMGQTTAVGLPYLLPRKKIYCTGAERSVFAMTPPNEELKRAADAFKSKDWQTVESLLTAYTADDAKPHQTYASKLLDAYRRMQRNVEFTIALIEKNIEARESGLARERLDSLIRLLGKPTPKLAAFDAMLPEKGTWMAREKAWPTPEACTILAPYVVEAAVGTEATNVGVDWEFIVPLAEQARESREEVYQIFRSVRGSEPNGGNWTDVDYAADGWKKQAGALYAEKGQRVWVRRTFKTLADPAGYKLLQMAGNLDGQVYLNGYKLTDRGGEVLMREGIIDVLRKDGLNVLAVTFVGSGKKVDFGLRASPPIVPDLDGILEGF